MGRKKSMEERTCQHCRFAHPLQRRHGAMLVCVRGASGRKSYTGRQPFERCGHFRRNHKERLIPVKGGLFAGVDAADSPNKGRPILRKTLKSGRRAGIIYGLCRNLAFGVIRSVCGCKVFFTGQGDVS